MPIVTYNGDSFSCTKAVKGADYIDLYNNDTIIVKFGGIIDFAKFSITDGSWSAPDGAEEVRGTASVSGGILNIAVAGEVGDNTIVKFCAPCDCSAVTGGVRINDTLYIIVDANDNAVTGSGAWSANAHVALLLSKSTGKAYIQNSAVNNSFTKEQSLSLANKTDFGLGSNAVPEEAFSKIFADGPHKVGDIKLTARADVSNEWVLCNGAYFKANDYPVYATVCPDQISLLSLANFLHYDSANGSSCFKHIVEADGYQVALKVAKSGTSNNLYVVYSTDWFETYVQYHPYTTAGTKIFSNNEYFDSAIIKYVGNTWFIAYCANNNYMNAVFTYTTSDITAEKSWVCRCDHKGYGSYSIYAFFDVWRNATTGQVYIACCGAPAGSESEYPFVLTLTSATATSATITQVSSFDGHWSSFTKDGDMLAFFAKPTSGTELANIFVCYTRAMTYDWTSITVYGNAISGGSYFVIPDTPHVRYHNGMWYLCGSYRKNNMYHPAVMYTTDITSSYWTTVYSESIAESSYNSTVDIRDLVFGRNYYVGTSPCMQHAQYSYLFFIGDIADPDTWRRVRVADYNDQLSGDVNNNSVLAGNYISAGAYSSASTIVFPAAGYGTLLKLPLYALPKIKCLGYNAYVKIS